MKHLLALGAGIIIGVIGTISTCYIFTPDFNYVELEKDYQLANGGILKAGTLLKQDTEFPEGFTQYKLYINIMGFEHEYLKPHVSKKKRIYQIIPFWAEPIE
jgi:hypothetical protein